MNIRPLLPLCAGLLLAACVTTRPRPAAPPPAPAVVIGVASCDAYLSSYLACHRAAETYPANQLQVHYQAMRDILLQASQNPQARPYLDARCRLLASQMRQDLQGRPCDASGAAGAH